MELNVNVPGAKATAQNRAKRSGTSLQFQTAWSNEGYSAGDWIFGPDPALDNIYQCLPQVILHGMDEGLVSKLNHGSMSLYLDSVADDYGMDATAVTALTYTTVTTSNTLYKGPTST